MRAHTERRRDAVIEGLLSGLDIQDAAKNANVAPRTVYTWTRQESFRQRLEQGREIMFERNVSQLADLAGGVIRRMRQIIDNDEASPAHWLRTAEIVLREGRASEAQAIRERMDQIEELLRERNMDGPETNAAGNPNA